MEAKLPQVIEFSAIDPDLYANMIAGLEQFVGASPCLAIVTAVDRQGCHHLICRVDKETVIFLHGLSLHSSMTMGLKSARAALSIKRSESNRPEPDEPSPLARPVPLPGQVSLRSRGGRQVAPKARPFTHGGLIDAAKALTSSATIRGYALRLPECLPLYWYQPYLAVLGLS